MTLPQMLHWLGGAGAGWLASFLLGYWQGFGSLSKKAKRFVSMGLTFLIGSLAGAGILGLAYAAGSPFPVDWVSILIQAGVAAVVAAQAAHGLTLKE